jgi:hypothetical protein
MVRYLALAALAACSSTAHPITNQTPSARYVLVPRLEPGGEGLHSAWHSWTLTTGALELRGDRVTVSLEHVTSSSPVTCTQPIGMQACAGPDARERTTTTPETLTEPIAWHGAAFTAGRLHCTQQAADFACTLGDQSLVFVTNTPRRFALARTALVDAQVVQGSVTLAGTAASLHLELAGHPLDRTATVERAPAGLVIRTNGVSLICRDTAPNLDCDLSIDRGAFGTPSTYGPVVLARG